MGVICPRFCRAFQRTWGTHEYFGQSSLSGSGSVVKWTVFQSSIYDTNKQLFPLVLSHSVGTQSEGTWGKMFLAMAIVLFFPVHGFASVVDQDKSIYTAFKAQFYTLSIFLDMFNFQNNLAGL